jgi:hypothetical protein
MERSRGTISFDPRSAVSEQDGGNVLNEKVIKLEDNDKVLKSENTFLQHELVKLKEDNKILKDVQDELEQYGRRECLEIRGVPITTDEDTNAIVIKLASKIGVQVKEAGRYFCQSSTRKSTIQQYCKLW